MCRLVPRTVTGPWGVDKEPDSVLDAKGDVVPIAEVVSGEPVTSNIKAVSVMALGPDVGREAIVGDQLEGCSWVDMLVPVARELTLLSGLDVVVRTESFPTVVTVAATSGVGVVVTPMMLTSAGDEVGDSGPGMEAASPVTTPVMATRVLDPIEGNVTDGEVLIIPPEALVGLVVAWLLKVRDGDVVLSVAFRCNVSVASGDAP